MTPYLQTQAAVYRHLLERNTTDKTFTFSLRQSFRKAPTSTEGLFIGTEKSRYFAFTLWNIPVSYPGSSADLLDYIIELNRDGSYRLAFQLFTTKKAETDQNRWSLELAESLLEQHWPPPVRWVEDKPDNQIRQLVYTKDKRLPSIPALLSALDELLNETVTPVNRAIAQHQAHFPTWKAARFTQQQFQLMRSKTEEKCAAILDGSYVEPDHHRPRSFWCVQLEGAANAEQELQEFERGGFIAPRLPADAPLAQYFQNRQAHVSSPELEDKKLGQLVQDLLGVRAGDVVVVTQGARSVLAVGVTRAGFAYHAEEAAPYRCEVQWVVLTPVGVQNNTFLTSVPFARTHQWQRVLDAYAVAHPGQANALALALTGQDFPTPRPPELSAPSERIAGGHWWLNINPAYWRVQDHAVGEEQSYTTHNEKGNKRNVYKHFREVQPGDLLVGYETSPIMRVKALLEVTAGVHENEEGAEAISFKLSEFLPYELTREQLLQMPELAQAEPMRSNQGSLFKLTPEEYSALVARAKGTATPALPRYTWDEARAELLMTQESVQHMLAALRRKKNLILQGPPGVGKTFVARRLAFLMMGQVDKQRVQLVQFHQSYGYEDFIRGWRPNADGKGGFELVNGVFLDFVRRAQHDPQREYFFVIDEINRGNLSKIFGELLLLLETDKRGDEYAVPLTYPRPGEAPFFLPENLFVIGTMNTADRSLAMVDYALRRRFTFVDLVPVLTDRLVRHLDERLGVPPAISQGAIERTKRLNAAIENDKNLGAGFAIGHSYFCSSPEGEDVKTWWANIVQHELAPTLREYWFDDLKRAQQETAALLGE